jgi:hypothetical protein
MTTTVAAPVSPVAESAPFDAGLTIPRDGFDLGLLCKRLGKSVLANADKGALLRDTARHLVAAVGCKWVVYLEGGGQESNAVRWHLLAGPDGTLPEPLQRAVAECAGQTLSKNTAHVKSINGASGWVVAGVPVTGDALTDSLLAVFDEPLADQAFTAALELAAVHIVLWRLRSDLTVRGSEADSAATLADLSGRLASSDDLAMGCYRLVNEFQRHLGCEQVVLGLCRGAKQTCRVAAISGVSRIDQRSERLRALEAVLDEALVRDELTTWPPTDASDRHAMLAHKRLAESVAVGCVISCPIRDEQGTVQGAWLFLGDEGPLVKSPQTTRLILAAATPVGSCLALLRRAEQGWLGKKLSSVREALRKKWSRVVLVGIALLVAAMFIPLPYRLKCDCELQPVIRRYVAAPFDATLERSHVEPGDLVSREQLLAQIDGREIRWELAGVDAEKTRASKERDGHLATQEFGSAQVAAYEMERLDLKVKLLEHRGENVEIRSPLDGIVISGDLKKAEGVPLTVGQTLFEIAPLDRMIVEIAVPEEDVRHVRTGQTVDIVLDAFPRERFQGSLARIHPRSEVKETEHVFIAEFELENPLQLLRPGMGGSAKITTDRHPLVWNLFHKPWEKALYWMGW